MRLEELDLVVLVRAIKTLHEKESFQLRKLHVCGFTVLCKPQLQFFRMRRSDAPLAGLTVKLGDPDGEALDQLAVSTMRHHFQLIAWRRSHVSKTKFSSHPCQQNSKPRRVEAG